MIAGRLPVTLFVCLVLVGLYATSVDAGKITATKQRRSTAVDAATAEKETTAIQAVANNNDDEADDDTDDDTSLTSSLNFWGMVRSVWNWVRDDFRESLLVDDDNADTDASGDNSTTSTAATARAAEGRTFGKIRRLQMALIPIVFKFGILSAMVGFLVLLGMKTLFLVKVLVVMNAVAILAKFLTFKTSLSHVEHSSPPVSQWSGYSSGWSPSSHTSSGWTSPGASYAPTQHHNNKEIHLHIHGGGVGAQLQSSGSSYGSPYGVTSGAQQQHQQGWERRSDPYGAYEPQSTDVVQLANELNNDGPLSEPIAAQIPHNHRMY